MSDRKPRGKSDTSTDEWDFDHAGTRNPARRPRAVVSVAFPRDDFELVESQARRLGKKVSEFIREAAVARAKPTDPIRLVGTFGGTSGTFFSPDVGFAPAGVNGPRVTVEVQETVVLLQ